MKIVSLVLVSSCLSGGANAWAPPSRSARQVFHGLSVSLNAEQQTTEGPGVTDDESSTNVEHTSLSQDLISKLRFRELRHELDKRQLPTDGTTSQLRRRLREAVLPGEDEECIVNEDGIEDDCQPVVR